MDQQIYYYKSPNDIQVINFGVDWGYTYTDKTKPTMKKLTTMFKKLVDGDTQALAKAGFINGDLDLTQLGKDELMAIVFDQYKTQLVAAAKLKIEEDAASVDKR